MKDNCPNYLKNIKDCTCSYASCSRKGKCCECVAYHKRNREIPGCFFSPKAESSYDRSYLGFLNDLKKQGIQP